MMLILILNCSFFLFVFFYFGIFFFRINLRNLAASQKVSTLKLFIIKIHSSPLKCNVKQIEHYFLNHIYIMNFNVSIIFVAAGMNLETYQSQHAKTFESKSCED